MMIRPLIGVWLTTIIWIGAIGGLWAHEEHLLTHGREITLQVLPIDPRDLLRGDYVILRYGISHYNAAYPYKKINVGKGQTVYVSLKLDGQAWKIDEITSEKPAHGVFLQGKITGILEEKYRTAYDIVYGIESYFVPEGEGKRLETLRNKKQLSALLNVTPDGQAKIKKLVEK